MLENINAVSALVDYLGSDVSDGRNYNQGSNQRKPVVEFGKIFRSACDELKEESGNAHQLQGYGLQMGYQFTPMMSRLY